MFAPLADEREHWRGKLLERFHKFIAALGLDEVTSPQESPPSFDRPQQDAW